MLYIQAGSSLHIPVTWPAGTYGLMKTGTGCPGGNVAWESGWRFYDSEDVNPQNHFTSHIERYMAGILWTTIHDTVSVHIL